MNVNTRTLNIANSERKRVFYFDVLRTIACLSVVLYHVCGNFESIGFSASGIGYYYTADYWISYFLHTASRLGVPIFAMISGALLLDETYAFTSEKLKKHLIKIIVFYVFWLAVYAGLFKIALPLYHKESISISEIMSVSEDEAYHLWFCPMIIGLYLFAPILKLWVNDKNKKFVEYYLILSAVLYCTLYRVVAIVGDVVDISGTKSAIDYMISGQFTGYVFFFILGWYLHNYDIKHKALVIVAGIIGFLISYFWNFTRSLLSGTLYTSHTNSAPNVVLMAILLFLAVKWIIGANSGDGKGYIFFKSVSKYSFGIYGVHQIAIYFSTSIVSKINVDFTLFNIIVVFLISAGLSYIVSYLFSKIPFLKRVV